MKYLLLFLALLAPCRAQTCMIMAPSGTVDLQYWWPFEDLSAGSTTAKFGGVNGTVTGATLVAGLLGNCLAFNGSSQYLTAGTAFRPAFNQAWMISCWIFPTDVGATNLHTIFDTFDFTSDTGILFRVGNSTTAQLQVIFATGASKNRQAYSVSSVTANTWHHVIAAWDGSANATVYLDSVGHSNDVINGTPASFAYVASTTIGRWSFNGTGYYQGNIDNIMCSNHYPTQTEVNYLYRFGRDGGQ